MYEVRRVHIGRMQELDEVAHACGELYSKTLVFCANTCCGFSWHRDGVGAINIRQKYLGCGPVVGAMAPPIGMRFRPHADVAHSEKG